MAPSALIFRSQITLLALIWVPFSLACGDAGTVTGSDKSPGCQSDSECNDDTECTVDTCDPTTHKCVSSPDDAQCADDGLYCTGVEVCAPANSSSDPTSGCMSAGDPCTSGTECNQTCDEASSTCFDPAGVSCTDSIISDCQAAACDGSGACVQQYAPTADGVSCDDQNFCNGADTCDASGACAVHAGDPCVGGATCNASCNEVADNCRAPASSPCDDLVFCNGTDQCNDAGQCTVHAGDPCDASSECNTTCDETASHCFDALDTPCTDVDATNCFDASCDGAGACDQQGTAVRSLSACDDGIFCNGDDRCDGIGGCVNHDGDPCDGGLECAATCNESAQDCLALAAAWCMDTNLMDCHFAQCDGQGTCNQQYADKPMGASCGDGTFCNGAETCGASASCLPAATGPCGALVCDEKHAGCEDDSTWSALGDSDYGPWSVHFVGTSWGVGISDTSGYSSAASVAVDTLGRPTVAWADETSGVDQIYVRGFDGQRWVDLGTDTRVGNGISASPLRAAFPAVAVNAAGAATVAWRETTATGTQIYVKRFDGTQWVEVGAGSASGNGVSQSSGSASSAALALNAQGHPVLAWTDTASGTGEIYVAQFDGSGWVSVGTNSLTGGGISANGGPSGGPSLALDASGNPTVAWNDSTSGVKEIYLKRFDGTNWVEQGFESASNGGISASSGTSSLAEVALDSAGLPTVVWSDTTPGTPRIYVRQFDGSAWVELDGSATSTGVSTGSVAGTSPDIAIDASGAPVVVWQRMSSDREVMSLRFNGSQWLATASGSSVVSRNEGYSTQPALAVSSSGAVVVAWSDDDWVNYEIYAKEVVDGSWMDVCGGVCGGGGISSTSGRVSGPSLAVADSGDAVVTWGDSTPYRPEVYVKRFSGGVWSEAGTGAAAGGGISNNDDYSMSPSVSLSSAGVPTIAWEDLSGSTWNVYVRQQNVDTWEEVGAGSASGEGMSNTSRSSTKVAVVLDNNDLPVVVWQDKTEGHHVYGMRYDGTAWQEIGPGSASGYGINNTGGWNWLPALALDSAGQPVVAWQHNMGRWEIYVKHFDGTAWQELGGISASGYGISNSVGDSSGASVAVDASDRIYVVYGDDTSGISEIHAKVFDGSQWQDVGANLSYQGGVSATSGTSGSPSLTLDSTGSPVVAWNDDSSGNTEIYVRRFDGTHWSELGTGSASGGGISNIDADSVAPSISAAAGKVCVSWTQWWRNTTQIVLRCADEP